MPASPVGLRQILFVAMSVALVFALVGCNTAPTTAATLDPNTPEGRGLALYVGKGRCAGCHSRSAGTVIIGPSLAGIGAIAANREAGVSAEAYLKESILDPDKFKAPGFEQSQMDASLATTRTSDEIADLVAYMLTLR